MLLYNECLLDSNTLDKQGQNPRNMETKKAERERVRNVRFRLTVEGRALSVEKVKDRDSAWRLSHKPRLLEVQARSQGLLSVTFCAWQFVFPCLMSVRGWRKSSVSKWSNDSVMIKGQRGCVFNHHLPLINGAGQESFQNLHNMLCFPEKKSVVSEIHLKKISRVEEEFFRWRSVGLLWTRFV